MHKHPAITEERIHKSIDTIRARCVGPAEPVELAAWHVGGEPVPLETALAARYEPFQVGDAWGPLWDTTWFRVRGRIPAEWVGREVSLLMQPADHGGEGFTAEGLVYFNGQILRALNAFRNDVPLTNLVRPGDSFELYVEAAANVAHAGGIAVGLRDHPCFRLVQAELACVHPERYAYYYDFVVMAEAMQALPENSQRRADLRFALNASLNVLDPENPAAAREVLAPALQRKNGDTVHQLSAIGHAHIDTAWLWPLRESMRKCARTFSTAVEYMESYPEYLFGCSQAQQYAWMKARYPAIYEKIRQRIRSGQWEPIGSMWVEMDCNLASGESLVRQILKGKQYFRDEFGYETKDAWLPDVFGYSAALPQIFRQCGIEFFVTQKISWNQFNTFPHHTFYWEGIDGTRIFTHFPPADTYNARMDVKSLVHNVDNFQEHGFSDRSLYVYGYGDGGGGPTVEMLERMRRMKDFDGLPTIAPQRVEAFLQQAEAEAHDLPVWVGELYLELHRGTYTTQASTKRNNRKCELLLRETEFFDAVGRVLNPSRSERAVDPERAVYDVTGLGADDTHTHARALDRAWKLVLLNQFHDIIPGSSITWVYEDAERDYQVVRELCDSVLAPSLQQLDDAIDTSGFSQPVRIANTLGFDRTEVVALPGGALTTVSVPACGYTVVDDALCEGEVTIEKAGDQLVLDNGLLRVVIEPDGLLSQVTDLTVDREVLAPGERGNRLQLHPDVPNNWDAWDVYIFYKEQVTNLTELEERTVHQDSPLQARVRVVRRFGHSRITQDMVLTAGSARIDFETEVDWQEENKFLKAAFPVNVLSPRATYEIQYGHVERPTHYNTSWDLARFEVCAHKWADLSESDYGVALLNDCKYGYDILGNVMRLSLLRAPTAPAPKADRGTHRFTYSLYPHAGDCRQGGVIEEAYQLNVPLQVQALPVQKGSRVASQSFFSVNRPGVFIESVKVPEDGEGVIVRLYEGYGSRGTCTLSTSLPFAEATRTNLLEEEAESLPLENGTVTVALKPFEIVTLRLQ